MTSITDAIRARNADPLRHAPADQLRVELLAFWDGEEAADVPDLDYLMQAGMLTARADAADVERLLSGWLDKNTSPNAWDTTGAFLMGYWQERETIDTPLADRLTKTLLEGKLPAGAKETVICALGHAFRKTSDESIRERIRETFAPIWERERNGTMQPLVRSIMKNVLDIEE